jgi:DNA-binding HxlR family transcriptional regulator
MPLRSDWSGMACPIARSLDVVGDPWLMLILRDSLMGVRRYDDYRRSLGIADNILSKRLATMVDAGLLAKAPYKDQGRSRNEYVLTEAGAELLPVVHALLLWGEKHTTSPQDAPLQIRHEPCGQVSNSADRCEGCGGPLTPDTVTWVRRGRKGRVTPLAVPGGHARTEPASGRG